jgi:8-oxo-dGTP pyrophosphatase MutT (NUDIX family)
VGIAAHIARLRAVVGHELLLAPSVSVLPVDQAGRLLLVRHAGHDDGWGVLRGAVDVGESPAAAAVREAREEISADVQLLRLVDVLGGPDYEISYPTATAPPTSPRFTKPGSSTAPRLPAMTSSANLPGSPTQNCPARS